MVNCFTYKDTSTRLGLKDDVHWIVDSVKAFLILIDFLRVYPCKPSDQTINKTFCYLMTASPSLPQRSLASWL